MTKWSTIVFVLVLALLGITAVVWANGEETLGEPSIPIATGSSIVSAGIGTESQPASFDLDVPIDSAIKQVLLYWSGATEEGTPGDDTILLNDVPILGEHIGTGPGRKWYESYRADITDMGLVSNGLNTFTVSGMDFVRENDGASILVILDDGTNTSEILLRDGLDIAYINRPEPGQTTVAQSFAFASQNIDRTAELTFFVGSVLKNRPNLIQVTVEGEVTDYYNLLASAEGNQWDNLTIPVNIPAGADDLTVQILSEAPEGDDRLPASLTWINVTLTVPIIPPPSGCIDFGTLTPGTSVEGFGVLHPALNISTTSGRAVVLAEGHEPAAYYAMTPDDPRLANGALLDTGGFADFARVHDYAFTFAPGVTVSDFQVRMLDYGDLNILLAEEHELQLVAYDVDGNVINADIFSFTSDPTILPRGGSAGDLMFTGDAGTAVNGEPGNRMYRVTGEGIARVEFHYSNSNGTTLPSDSHFALGELCFDVTPLPQTCVGFAAIAPGQPVEGLGTVNPLLNITTSGQAIALAAGQEPAAYYAMTAADPRLANGALAVDGGFADLARIHDYAFTFAPGTTISDFQIRMLDYGDLNILLATEHEISLVAYDAHGNIVGKDSFFFTSDGNVLPRGGSAGDLMFTGDAGTSVDGDPGNRLYSVAGENISRVELHYQNDGSDSPSDSHFALGDLCFTPEN